MVWFHARANAERILGTAALCCIVLLASFRAANAQAFTSGSTGVDGPLDYSGMPPGSVVIFDPTKLSTPLPLGTSVFNFSRITIPAGVTVKLRGDVINAPVYWLSQGPVIINGMIDLNGENGSSTALFLAGRGRPIPGAGGYSGGLGGKQEQGGLVSPRPVAQPGDGPGGGAADRPSNCGPNGGGGGFTGNSFLVPLVGGSGGGGATLTAQPGELGVTPYGSGGGAGGGAILIASSTSNSLNGGIISANGGAGGPANFFCNNSGSQPGGAGGGGAGGAIRLAAPTVTGQGTLTAIGGGSQSSPGGRGMVRVESLTDTFSGAFNGTPATLGSPIGTFLAAAPSVSLVSVNGINLVQPTTGGLAVPDVTIDTSSPVELVIKASGIPVGTVVTLKIFSDNNSDQLVQTTPLAGTLDFSTATASVTFPIGYSLGYVKASWVQ